MKITRKNKQKIKLKSQVFCSLRKLRSDTKSSRYDNVMKFVSNETVMRMTDALFLARNVSQDFQRQTYAVRNTYSRLCHTHAYYGAKPLDSVSPSQHSSCVSLVMPRFGGKMKLNTKYCCLVCVLVQPQDRTLNTHSHKRPVHTILDMRDEFIRNISISIGKLENIWCVSELVRESISIDRRVHLTIL